MSYDVEFFALSNGKVPVKEFLQELEGKLRAKTVKNIQLLELFGSELREPFSKPIEEGIFELRTKQSNDIDRVFYFFQKERKIILTNGFVKKTNQTPKNEIELAKKYKREYEERT